MSESDRYANKFTLIEWRRQIFALYARIRLAEDPQAAWADWRNTRNHLFATHSQSPLPASIQQSFTPLAYHPYHPTWRVMAQIDTAVSPDTFRVQLPGDGAFAFTRIARLHFTLDKQATSLDLFWIEGYGGGLFLPFRDASNGVTSYGGGRYLIDSIKGADFGGTAVSFPLDFNFAYNPSCVYSPRWVCPLAPPQNRLPLAVTAGEKMFG